MELIQVPTVYLERFNPLKNKHLWFIEFGVRCFSSFYIYYLLDGISATEEWELFAIRSHLSHLGCNNRVFYGSDPFDFLEEKEIGFILREKTKPPSLIEARRIRTFPVSIPEKEGKREFYEKPVLRGLQTM